MGFRLNFDILFSKEKKNSADRTEFVNIIFDAENNVSKELTCELITEKKITPTHAIP